MANGPTMEAVEVTADGAAVTGKGTFYGVSVFAGTARIYDNASAASGKVICQTSLPGIMLGQGGVEYENGLYMDLTTGPTVVYFTRHS